MQQTTLLTVFIAVTAVAVLLQAGVLLALYLTVNKTAANLERVTEEVRSRAVPVLESAQSVLADNRKNIDSVVADSVVIAREVRETLAESRPHVAEILTMAKEKIARADEMVSRTMDRVEQTTDSITAPVRRVNGVVKALGAMFGSVLNGPRR